MAVKIPVFLQGRHMTALVITGCSVAPDGTLTPGSEQSIIGKSRRVALRSNPVHDNLSPVTRPLANMMIAEDNTSVEVDVLLVHYGVNELADLVQSFDVMLLQWTRGPQSWQFYGTRGDYDDAVESKGANSARLTLLQLDLGDNPINPLYSTP